ncbi:MAG: TIGR00730 family Rossman fold protein [Phycisphaerales bacterium]
MTWASLSPLCVYCASAWGARPAYRDAARAFGAALGERGIGLVYGGGKLGLMGEIADATIAGGGRVVGVITHDLKHKEVAHDGLTELQVVDTMHQRKKAMADLAAGFVALPGGVGTMDELFEVLAWAQLGIHAKPVGILNVEGYYDHLLRFIGHAAEEGFLRLPPQQAFAVSSDASELLEMMRSWQPRPTPDWDRAAR